MTNPPSISPTTTTTNKSTITKTKKGFARLFKRKQHSPPLCKQDSCSIGDDDDQQDLEQDVSSYMSSSNASSSAYSILSDKENDIDCNDSNRRRRRRRNKFIDLDSGELSDLLTLVSPSGVSTRQMKVPLTEDYCLKLHDINANSASAWFYQGGTTPNNDNNHHQQHPHIHHTNNNNNNTGDTNNTKEEGKATTPVFDLNVPQSFSDSDFDIPSFHNLGCNPFHQTDVSLFTSSSPWGKEKVGSLVSSDDGGYQKDIPQPDKESVAIQSMKSLGSKSSQKQQQHHHQQQQQKIHDKKEGFLKQMKFKVNKQLSKSIHRGDSSNNNTVPSSRSGGGFPPPKNSIPSQCSQIPSNSSSNDFNLLVSYQTSDETPRFTNKTTNNSTGTIAPIPSITTLRPSTKSISNNKTEMEKTIFTRSALSRPFGRTSLPSHLAKEWCVEVSPFYDESVKCWKYHILVQKEVYNTISNGHTLLSPVKSTLTTTTSTETHEGNKITSPDTVLQPPESTTPPPPPPTNTPPPPSSAKFFTTANVTRTLKDIVWLERALRDEYSGALIFPTLSMTLTSGTDWTTAVTLDKDAFERGEWDPYHLSNELLNAVLEEEEFLAFDNTNKSGLDDDDDDDDDERRPPFDPKLISDWFNDILNGVRGKGELILNYGKSSVVDVMNSESMECFLYKVNEPLKDLHFMTKKNSNFSWLPFSLNFGQLTLNSTSKGGERDDSYLMKGLMTFPVSCLGNINACNPSGDDFSESDTIISRRTKNRTHQQSPEYWRSSMLPEDVKIQSYYIGVQRENSLLAMYRLRILLETEALVSVAWKRFAISLSNLFTAGRDIQSCKVVGTKGKLKISKVDKEKVGDCLRILARQKVDRATPSLKVLSGMLSAYYADFSSINPSLHAYSEGVKRLESEKASITTKSDDNWTQALKAVSPLTLFQNNDGVRDSDSIEMEKKVYEQRQSFNESLIKSSITQFCNSIDVRVARMSWKFFKMESGQATLLSNAADQVQNELEHTERNIDFNVIGEEGEVDLVRRLIDIGSKRKYKHHPYPKSCSSSHTGSESDLNSENGSSLMDDSVTDNVSTHNPAIEKLIDTVKKSDGRWNSKLALDILELSGVQDGEILVQESTREVRTVQRLADSLQVQIDRCSEALSMLRELAYGVQSSKLVKHRHEFLSDLAVVFSGSMYSKSRSKSRDLRKYDKILSKDGINSYDSFGWLSIVRNKSRYDNNGEDGCCGDLALNYEKKRELGTYQLIEELEEILDDQRGRVERLESFVYMNCVGNQLEKHFSRLRSEALAAWEKKTDITTAINIATKKRLTLLVNELKSKLASLSAISHTSVKEAKERHLGSKALKAELESLASSRFERLKQTSTDGVVKAIRIWAKHEKNTAAKEISALSDAIKEIEKNLTSNIKIIEADGGAHLFASSGIS